MVLSTSLCEFLQVSASFCEFLQVSASFYEFLVVSARCCEFLRVSASSFSRYFQVSVSFTMWSLLVSSLTNAEP